MDSFIDKETFVNRNRKLEDEMTAQELQLLKLKDKDIQNRNKGYTGCFYAVAGGTGLT